MRIFLPFSLVSINFAAEFMSMRMKKHLILLLSVLLFCACGGKKEGDVVDSSDLHWDVVERNTTLQLTSAANSPKAELHLIIYYIKDKGFEGVNDSLLLDGVLTPVSRTCVVVTYDCTVAACTLCTTAPNLCEVSCC